MAASGSAIGLGNIWRFPFYVSDNGGAAFVFLYLVFVIIIGLPYMMAEFALGRHMHKNGVGAIAGIKPGSVWKVAGLLGIATGIGILSYYGVIAGWTFGYVFKTALTEIDTGFIAQAFGGPTEFGKFASNAGLVIPLFFLFMLITTVVVYFGVEGGIEKWSKILMPILLVLLVGLIIYSNTLEGSSEGLKFYLLPDFSEVTGGTVLAALSQAFFSLSLGMGLMITYGSYLSKREDILESTLFIGGFDSMIALMSGLIIFPALYALGATSAGGAELVFVVFPEIFAKIPGGAIVGTIFFVLLSVAALTSTISLLEVPTAYLVDEFKMNRKSIVWFVSLFIFIVGLPSALSAGASDFLTNFGLFPEYLVKDRDFLSQFGFIFGDLSLSLGALLISIFIGWIWGAGNASDELEIGSKNFKKFRKIWIFMIRFFIPIVVFLILLNIFNVFDFVF